MLIFFYGEDEFRSRQKIKEIRKKYLASDKSGSGLSLFDLSEKKNVQDIISACEMANLLSPKRLLVVEGLIENALVDEQRELLNFLEKRGEKILEDQDLVIVFWEKGEPRKNNALFKFLEKKSKRQKFEKLSGIKLNAWIMKRISEINQRAKISKEALEKLVIFWGSDTRVLSNELEKLANYAGQEMISKEDVEALAKGSFSGTIFSTMDALTSGKKSEALALIHRHLERGEDPFYIFSMLLYQFRNLLKVAGAFSEGMTNQYELAKALKIHPFVAGKSLSQIRNFSLPRLKSIYQKLGELDFLVKTGKMEMKLAIDKFVAEV